MSVPIVPISEFKTNPARFMESGAVVTNHGKPRARLVPIRSDEHQYQHEREAVETAKAALAVLYRLQPADDVAIELAELAASRDSDLVGEPS